jgi:hypothetical protein
MGELTGAIAAAVGLAAVILPFVSRRVGDLPVSLKDIELAAGPRGPRTIFAALFLMLIMCGGIYATFAMNKPAQYWFGFLAGFIVVLMIAVVLPQGAVRRIWLRLLEYWLVAAAIGLTVVCLAQLVVAALVSEALLPRSRSIWIRADQEPFLFWYSIAGSALFVYLALTFLREYFTRVLERRRHKGSGNQPPARNARFPP